MPDGLAFSLFGVAAVVAALALALLIWRRGFQVLRAELGSARIELSAVNKAVNNVPAGHPTLSERVDLHTEWLGAIDSSVSTVQRRVKSLDESITVVEGQVARLPAVEAQLASLVTGLATLADALGHPMPPTPEETETE